MAPWLHSSCPPARQQNYFALRSPLTKAGWVFTFCWHTLWKPFYGGLPKCCPTWYSVCLLVDEKWKLHFNFRHVMFVNFYFSYDRATCSHFSSPFLSLHRDLLRIGVTLAGHQKKILGSIQDMRLQMNQTLPVQVWVTGHTDRCSRRTARQEKGEELCQRELLETLAAWPISAN